MIAIEEIAIEEIVINDEYKRLLPRVSNVEYENLKRDIQERGIVVPLVINQDKHLLDGYTRLQIAKELGISKVPVVIRNFNDRLEEKESVIALNLKRRHLNDIQKVMIARELLKIEQERARLRQLSALKQFKNKNIANDSEDDCSNNTTNITNDIASVTVVVHGTTTEKGRSIEKVAKMLNISNSRLKKGLRALELAEKDNTIKELFEKSDNLSFIIKKVEEKQAKEKVKPIRNNDNTNFVRLLFGDFKDKIREIEDNSIDLIFTDPPYSQDYLDDLEVFAKEAVRVLRPSSFIALMYGVKYLPEIFEIFKVEGLRYYWTIAMYMPDSNLIFHKRSIIEKWKPILLFQKEPFINIEHAIEDAIVAPKPDKSLHEWKQDTYSAKYVIQRLTREGDTVLDVFAGTGTTAEACLELKRNCILIEKDKSIFEVLQKRFNLKT
ncbi:DNA methyltransferase [Candidatus Nitrosocaldus islandicus]|uniref:DNA methyltransferase n=1 Tax=Candidatus Nitrosocaldus islandicus TaxID=2045011 RepID=UPI000CD21BD4|nr:DNA methyltransferase [Candidatus Nitrosocaldus islandicus]